MQMAFSIVILNVAVYKCSTIETFKQLFYYGLTMNGIIRFYYFSYKQSVHFSN